MGALTSLTKWNPEDDLLLKNAVEAGASLESLAKGAVLFSRRFTIRELEDRWRLLLYDASTSTEVSARIIEIEIGISTYNPSKPGRAFSLKVKETSLLRKKGESLQCHYYTARKKARYEPQESTKLGFLLPSSSHDHFKLQNEFIFSKLHLNAPFSTSPASSIAFQGGLTDSIEPELPVVLSGTDCFYGHSENISSIPINEAGFNDAGKSFEQNHCSSQASVHQLGYSSPTWRTIEDDSAPIFQMVDEKDDHICDDAAPMREHDDKASTAPIPLEANFIDFSESCMSFTDDEDLLLIDVDQDDIGERPCLNSLDSMLSSSSITIHINDLPATGNPEQLEAINVPAYNDAESFTEPVANLRCSVVSGVDFAEKMICVLNTEDQYIPNNDVLTLPAKLIQAIPNTNNLRQDSVHYDGRAFSGDSGLIKEGKISTQQSVHNLKADHFLLPKLVMPHPSANCKMDIMSADIDLLCGASALSNMDMSDRKSMPPTITSQEAIMDLDVDSAGMPSQPQLNSDLGCVDPLSTMPYSDQEEPCFENEDDEDTPNFSDVEAMILGMDLGPYDQESCIFTKEVSRYQSIETRKTIIKLEQGARSYVNRAISSRGAFAIFYGRHLKYFIRTIEVLIGRETEEIKVDIDLGKEGRANKISRRQAIIKMDENGYFHLKNIGKSSIFVNSKEVPVKKRINLSSCALIEIKDMRFIFEVNDLAVRRHLTSLQLTSRQPKSEFDFVYS